MAASATIDAVTPRGPALPVMGATAATSPKPIVIDTPESPAALRRIYDATRPCPDGYAPRLLVVHPDEQVFKDHLSRQALGDMLSDPRVWFATGAQSGAHLRHELHAHLDLVLPGQVITSAGSPFGVGATAIVEAALAEQQRLHATLREQAQRLYAGKGPREWAGRYASGEALRVLIPTTRYSTFVRHSAHDLAEALTVLGHQPRVLMEPDDHSKLATTAYLQQLAEWTPDLVVLINYTRSQMNQAMVEGVPLVCWIQDAMPHLFTKQAGASQGALDFVAGYLSNDLYESFGYPRQRAMSSPLVASARKFHSAPADRALRDAHTCEIAYVSHQSEPPEVFCQRMLAAAPAGTPARRAVEAAIPLVRAAAGDSMNVVVRDAVRTAAQSALRQATGTEPAAEVVSVFVNQFCAPLAERLFRHEALAWAADIAEARGWRLKVYGRGWDTHPRMRRYACGELEHGEALRASYQSAAVHLHVSTYSVVHQRVLECALSGGLACCRLQKREVDSVCHRLLEEGVRESEPARLTEFYAHFDIAPSPSLTRRAALERSLGIAPPAQYPAKKTFVERTRAQPPVDDSFFADLLLGDLAEMTFWSRQTLEALVERAASDDQWRRERIGAMARQVRQRMTTDVFAKRLVKFVGETMARA